jgi:uncharacterized membrane protein
MNWTQTGVIAGLILGLAASFGFIPFIVALAFGVIGLVAGRVVDGEMSIGDFFGRARDRR